MSLFQHHCLDIPYQMYVLFQYGVKWKCYIELDQTEQRCRGLYQKNITHLWLRFPSWGKEKNLQWKEKGRDCHCITYAKEPDKEAQIPGSFPQRVFFAQLGEFLSWQHVSGPHTSILWPSVSCFPGVFGLVHSVLIKKGREEAAYCQLSLINICTVFMTVVFLLWRHPTFIKNLELF